MPRARLVAHRDPEEDEDQPESSSSEDEDDMGQDGADEDVEDDDEDREAEATTQAAAAARAASATTTAPARKKLSISMNKNRGDVCKVCGSAGHRAGFVGATYLDCPNKPCYLCKLTGHTTATCPYRIAPGHGCTAAAAPSRGGARGPGGGGGGVAGAVLDRECAGSRQPLLPRPRVPRYQVEAAILKLHTRRCCSLEFHPTHDGIVVSGDKKGAIAVWNFNQVHERTVYDTVHSCLTNAVRFVPWLGGGGSGGGHVVSASSDGTVKLLDLETGGWRPLLDLNPGGWVQGGPWHMVYGCDASPALGCVLAGDSCGRVHLLDPRTRGSVAALQLHRRGNKVVSVHAHPLHPPLVLTAGNDHSARLFDIRALTSSSPEAVGAAAAAGPGLSPSGSPGATGSAGLVAAPDATPAGRKKKGAAGGAPPGSAPRQGPQGQHAAHAAELAVMHHPRVVNAAYFSPLTGRRILTTCQDNRLRVWDYAPHGCGGPPDREIVHSHDFNRYLTPFRAEWDPKDAAESVCVVGRYISEDFGGTALHPVDIIGAADGALLRQLTDTNLTTISPVNKPHPRRDLIVSGSSRSLYLWTPAPEEGEAEEEDADVRTRGRGGASGGGGTARGSGGGGGGGGGWPTRASRTFHSFDADPGGGAGGKKRKKGAGGGKAPAGMDDDDD